MKKAWKDPDLWVHWVISACGGFYGVYAVSLRGGTFGSAQTVNLIVLLLRLWQGDTAEVLRRLGALAVFSGILVLVYLLPQEKRRAARPFCVLAELAGVGLCGFLPAELDGLVALYPIFALSALQWGFFFQVRGFGCASIFSTNNLRQTVTAAAGLLLKREKGAAERLWVYGGTLLFYHTGVLYGILCVSLFTIKGIWGCALPLCLVLLLLQAEK